MTDGAKVRCARGSDWCDGVICRDMGIACPNAERERTTMADLVVQAWHTECGTCGYGSGGWASSPARQGLPILGPASRTCPGCGEAFTRLVEPYRGGAVTDLTADQDRAA